MRDRDAHRRCQCCGAAVRRGFWHDVGVAVANPSRLCDLRIVRVLTCLTFYCVSRKADIAKAA